MSLMTGNPPEEAFQIVSDVIDNLAGSPEAEKMSLTDPASCQVEMPLGVYVLGLDDVSQDALATARQVGWRYTVYCEGQPIVAAEVRAPAGEAIKFSHINQGQFVEATVAAMKQAESLEEVAESDYEARFLKIPALYVIALWLHSDTDDVLIPMPPTFDTLTPNEPYSAEEFFEILIPAAAARKVSEDPA
jgi:hypothetical protein